jgi:hypothetical protein
MSDNGDMDNHQTATERAFAELQASGWDIDEDSPFSEDLPDEAVVEMSTWFQLAGQAVVGYLSGLDNIQDEPEPAPLIALVAAGGLHAEAEFWVRYRNMDRERSDALLTTYYERIEAAAVETGYAAQLAAVTSVTQRDLLHRGRAMIEENWGMVVLVAAAQRDETTDIQGREIAFLRSVYGAALPGLG